MRNNLGRLKKVDLREVWEHEATSFTKWLSQEENLDHLGDELGISIKLLKTEAEVGGFNVDILAEEEGSARKIIIENQLETTDHDHLGKLITYASGTDANVIIWIFREIRDEHRSAIDWLNEHTDENVDFFAVKMELWQIGDSLPAPKFQIVSNPNNWAKIAKTNTEQSKLTPTKLYQFELWNKFKEFAQAHNQNLSFTKTYPQHWYNFSIGSSSCHVALTVNTRAKEFGCELYITDNRFGVDRGGGDGRIPSPCASPQRRLHGDGKETASPLYFPIAYLRNYADTSRRALPLLVQHIEDAFPPDAARNFLQSLTTRKGVLVAFNEKLLEKYRFLKQDHNDMVLHIPSGQVALETVLGFEALGDFEDAVLEKIESSDRQLAEK